MSTAHSPWCERTKITSFSLLLVKTSRAQGALGTGRMKTNFSCLLYNVAEHCLPKSPGQMEVVGECEALPPLRKHSNEGNRRLCKRTYVSIHVSGINDAPSLSGSVQKKMSDAEHIYSHQGHSPCDTSAWSLFFSSLSSWISEMKRQTDRRRWREGERIPYFYICLFSLWGLMRTNEVETVPDPLGKDAFVCKGTMSFSLFSKDVFPINCLILWSIKEFSFLSILVHYIFSDSTILLKRSWVVFPLAV